MGQLRALLKLVADNEARFFEALEQDLGKHPVEAYRDEVFFLNLLSRLNFFLIDVKVCGVNFSFIYLFMWT